MTKPNKLLLWDIDGTLVRTSRAGPRAIIRTLRELYGIESDLTEIDLRGNTDRRIAQELFAYHRLDYNESSMQALFERYFVNLKEELGKGDVTIPSGITEILKKIAEHHEIVQGLLTGNFEKGARIKLGYIQLWHYFAFGAFTDDSLDRNELGPFALRRAKEKYGVEFSPPKVFVIGDSPRDIECANAIGAKAIAVATGGHTLAELQEFHPYAAFENLADTVAFMKVIEE